MINIASGDDEPWLLRQTLQEQYSPVTEENSVSLQLPTGGKISLQSGLTAMLKPIQLRSNWPCSRASLNGSIYTPR